ncbi:MAG: integrin alpha [Pseudomonadota bacterium]
MSAQGLQAPSRRHGFRTYFEPAGIRVTDRIDPDAAPLFTLRLARIGRPGALAAVAPGRVASQGARVEIERDAVREWYTNSPAGLEQGFSLAARRAGAGPLLLELALEGAAAVRQGDAVRITTTTGRTLSYGRLQAFDARGAGLQAELRVSSPHRLQLRVDDRAAVYPISVDPLLTATAETLLESDQAYALFGFSVAAAGDVNGDGYDDVIVGAHTFDTGAADAGVAGVFLGSRNGVGDASIATAHARITGDQVEAWLGCSVSGAGDVNGDGYDDVIVGARRYDVGDWTDAGAAFVFLGSPAGLSDGSPESAQTRLLGDQDGGWLGYAVDAVGDINGDGYGDVIVGAGRYDTAREDDGAAFLFAGSAGGIADAGPASAYARFESGQARAYFGSAVAGAGDVDGDGVGDFIVGAYQYDCGQTNEGAAFVIPGGRLAPADSGGQAVAALGERCGSAAVELPFRKRTAALVLLAGVVVLLGLRYLRRRTTG